MDKTNKRIIIISLILALATAAMVFYHISGREEGAAPKIEHVSVFVAARTIPAGSEITAADIRKAELPKEAANANAASDTGEILGKRANENIYEGEQFIKDRLADAGEMSLPYLIPGGMRAVSMNVNEQVGVANLLEPGDRVDVVASFEKEGNGDGGSEENYPRITKVVLQDVLVLAVGSVTDAKPEKQAEPPMTVTLAVKKDEIEKFVYASEYGVIRLALRPAGDGTRIDSHGIVRQDMTGTRGMIEGMLEEMPQGMPENENKN